MAVKRSSVKKVCEAGRAQDLKFEAVCAVQVGFRGKKRDKPTAMEQLLGGTGSPARFASIA